MIIVGNARGGGQDLASHLLKQDNEHVHVADMRGFAAEHLHGAFKEAYALSRGSKARKYLFSLSLNPPEGETVSTEDFESAIAQVEETLGFGDLPRAIVYHEKLGRRHCHVVYCRIDPAELKAVPVPFYKTRLQDVARSLYIAHDWKMPEGFRSHEARDVKNFSFSEYQQALRLGKDVRALKAVFQESWAISDSKAGFIHAMREHGLIVAQGDRRGYVAVDRQGEVYALARWIGIKTKQVRERMGKADTLPSVEAAKVKHNQDMQPAVQRWHGELSKRKKSLLQIQQTQVQSLVTKQKSERKALSEAQQKRWKQEARARQERYRKGFTGLWDRLRGQHGQITARNEREALLAFQRDRREMDALIYQHLDDRLEMKTRHHYQRDQLKNDKLLLCEARQRFRDLSAPVRTVSRDGPEPTY